MNLYDVARKTCHEFGMTWYHPVTGKAYPPPKKAKPQKRKRMAEGER